MESLPHGIRQKQKKKNLAKGAKLINKDFNLNYKLKKRELTKSHDGNRGLGI